MIQPKNKETWIYAPLNLLYTAYRDDRLTVGTILEEAIQTTGIEFPALSEDDRKKLFQKLCSVCEENEQFAFQAGLCTGFRLAEEVRTMTFD